MRIIDIYATFKLPYVETRLISKTCLVIVLIYWLIKTSIVNYEQKASLKERKRESWR